MTIFFRVIVPATAVLGLFIAFANWVHPFNADRRALSVSYSQNIELLATPDKLEKGSLQFVYQGANVENLVYTKIRFRNDGNLPLQKTDFIKPIGITFPTDARIIKFSLIKSQPLDEATQPEQSLVQKVSDTKVEFSPVLVNPGEIFDIDIITTRAFGRPNAVLAYSANDIKFDYQIYGVSKITETSGLLTNQEIKNQSRKTLYGWFWWLFEPLWFIGVVLAVGLLSILILSVSDIKKSEAYKKFETTTVGLLVLKWLPSIASYWLPLGMIGGFLCAMLYKAFLLPV